MADDLARGYFDGPTPQEKSYTLTMVCDPEDAGIDQRFAEYKQWTIERDGASMQPRRLVINAQQQATSSQKNGSLLLSPSEEEKFRRHNQQIGKVVFLKDGDIEILLSKDEGSASLSWLLGLAVRVIESEFVDFREETTVLFDEATGPLPTVSKHQIH